LQSKLKGFHETLGRTVADQGNVSGEAFFGIGSHRDGPQCSKPQNPEMSNSFKTSKGQKELKVTSYGKRMDVLTLA
jgi:hypothetical protein